MKILHAHTSITDYFAEIKEKKLQAIVYFAFKYCYSSKRNTFFSWQKTAIYMDEIIIIH